MSFGNYGKKEIKEELNYEVIKKYGCLTTEGKANKELRLISWNGAAPKFDLRPWIANEDGTEKMNKGVTLTSEEIGNLFEILKTINEEE